MTTLSTRTLVKPFGPRTFCNPASRLRAPPRAVDPKGVDRSESGALQRTTIVVTDVQAPRHRFPPVARIEDFLAEAERLELLNWVLANRERFQPAEVSDKGSMLVDPEVREALTLRGFGSELPWLAERLGEVQDDLIARLGLTIPLVESLEVELAAHGDGAHFAAHLDIPVGAGRQPRGGRPPRDDDRLLSAVYYFYKEPKGFTGGTLRIHPFASDGKEADDGVAGSFIEIEPAQNSLVAFPSWATHEVRRISVPSKAFEDYRFAVNCWFCGHFGN